MVESNGEGGVDGEGDRGQRGFCRNGRMNKNTRDEKKPKKKRGADRNEGLPTK